MNIIFIVIKEIKHSFRDKRSMAIMILFPILLIVVLGSAFKSGFSNTNNIGIPKVIYKIESSGIIADNF